MADWSNLTTQLLQVIAIKLGIHRDTIFFSAVCSSWKSIGFETRNELHRRLPRLVIPGDSKESETRNYVEPVEGDDGYIAYSLDRNQAKQVPVPHRSYCCGSSLGWLVLIDDNFNMQLFNPLSEEKFELPSSRTLPPAKPGWTEFSKYYVNKAIISVDPTSSTPPQTTVLLIYAGFNHRLAFCKLGDKQWTPIDQCSEKRGICDNVLYYNDKFFAIHDPGYCDIVDIDNKTLIPYAGKPEDENCSVPRYLVECEGNLYLLERAIRLDSYTHSDGDESSEPDNENEQDGDNNGVEDDNGHSNSDESSEADNEDKKDEEEGGDNDSGEDEDENGDENQCRHENIIDLSSSSCSDIFRRYKTTGFIVFKLEERSVGRRYWKEVDNIGDNAFFVGYNSSFSLSATDRFGYKTCKPNSIYFTDDETPLEHMWDPIRHDIGVFNLDSGKIESLFPAETQVMRPPPFWFEQKGSRNS